MEFEQVFQLLVLAAVVVVFWWTNQSFPPGPTAQLIKDLRDAADKTPNKYDDTGVLLLELLNDLRLKQAQVPPPSADDGQAVVQ